MNNSVRIHGFLHRSRRRLLWQESAVGLSLLLCLFALVLLASSLILPSSKQAAWWRLALFALSAVGGLALLGRYGLRPWWQFRHDSAWCLELERKLTDARSLDLVSAVQLEKWKQNQSDAPSMSLELIDAHIESVAQGLSELRPQQILPSRRLWPNALASGLLLAVMILWASLAPSSLNRAWQSLWSQAAGLPASGTLENSWIGDIQLTYHYPAYTARAERSMEGTDGAILALPGTRVTLRSRTDRPIKQAKLHLGTETLPLAVQDQHWLSTDLMVMKASRYRFALEDSKGRSWVEARGHPITLESDRRPKVRLSEPAEDRVVGERELVTILYDARDDFGIGQVQLVWRVTGKAEGEQKRILHRPSSAGHKSSRRSFRWDLAKLELEPGQRVQFHIEASDNDTVLGPKIGRSTTCNLKVFSAAEHHGQLMGKVQKVWEGLLSNLADNLDLEPAAGKPAPTDLLPYQKIYQSTEIFLATVASISAELHKDDLAYPPLVQTLSHVQQRVSSLQQRLVLLLKRSVLSADSKQDILRRLTWHRAQRIRILEQDVLYLEDLLDMVRLQDLDRLARDLSHTRDRLAELMKKYQQAPSDEARRQIEAEIARLKEKVAELLARQQEVVKGIRDEYLNPDALRKMLSDRDMMGALDRMQAMMREGKMDQAMAELDRLQKQLNELQKSLDQTRAQYGEGKYRELAQQVAKTLAELNQIGSQQRQLAEQTDALRKDLFEQIPGQEAALLKRLFARLRKKLEKVRTDIEQSPDGLLDAFTGKMKERSLQHIRLLDMALAATDISASTDAAAKLTEAIAMQLQDIKLSLRFPNRSMSGGKKKLTAQREAIGRAHRGSKEILAELKKLLPDPDKHLSKRQRQQLRRMSGQQAALESRVQKLRQQMRQINDQAPLFGKDAMGRMLRGQNLMRRAGSSLDDRRPDQAHPHQQSALMELEAVRKSLEKSCKKGGGGMPMPMGGAMGRMGGSGGSMGRNQERDIEIPSPDDYQPPEAFRKALLEGMKDPVPEDFQEQVRRYYEELVR